MITECLFCRDLIDTTKPGMGQWYGHPCHLACCDWMKEGLKNYNPIHIEEHENYDPAHQPVVYGWCGASFQEYDYEWHALEDAIKEKLYCQYLHYLTKLLDQQEIAIKAYCKRHGLPEPKIIRELKQSAQHMVEVYRLMGDSGIKPGDHLVIAILPRSQRHKHKSAQLTKNIANRMAKMGVTFHSAFAGLDWSKPIAQAVIDMAVKIQVWQQSIYRDQIEHNKGKITRLFGYSWRQIQRHQTFQWVIRHIRDKKMSPAEVFNASRHYWSVHAYVHNNKRWWNLLITKDKYLAWEKRKQNHYYCPKHKIVSLLNRCPSCGRSCNFTKTLVCRGVNLDFRRRDHEDDVTYSAMWAFYMDNHPDQEWKPWENRSRFPENLKLLDINVDDYYPDDN